MSYLWLNRFNSEKIMKLKKIILFKSTAIGLMGTTVLILMYFVLLTWVAGDWRHPMEQFLSSRYLLGALFIGFGVQAGLYWLIRNVSRNYKHMKAVSGTSTGISVTTMVICCAHHVFDFLPILGLSAFSIVLAQYQNYLITFAVISNIFGISYMLISSKPVLKNLSFN